LANRLGASGGALKIANGTSEAVTVKVFKFFVFGSVIAKSI
jgi:hypothetical protein